TGCLAARAPGTLAPAAFHHCASALGGRLAGTGQLAAQPHAGAGRSGAQPAASARGCTKALRPAGPARTRTEPIAALSASSRCPVVEHPPDDRTAADCRPAE